MKRFAPGKRGGYTLVELAIASVLLAVVLGSLLLFGDRSTDALGTNTAQSELDTRLRRALVRMAGELLPSGFSVIVIDADGAGLEYRKSSGPVNGKNTWGPRLRFAFAHDVGELDDGLDNDHDGVPDDGVLQWTTNLGAADEQTIVLCRGVSELDGGELSNGADDDGDGKVDERGLQFTREGDTLRIRLTLARRDPEGHLLARTLETTVQPRN